MKHTHHVYFSICFPENTKNKTDTDSYEYNKAFLHDSVILFAGQLLSISYRKNKENSQFYQIEGTKFIVDDYSTAKNGFNSE